MEMIPYIMQLGSGGLLYLAGFPDQVWNTVSFLTGWELHYIPVRSSGKADGIVQKTRQALLTNALQMQDDVQ